MYFGRTSITAGLVTARRSAVVTLCVSQPDRVWGSGARRTRAEQPLTSSTAAAAAHVTLACFIVASSHHVRAVASAVSIVIGSTGALGERRTNV
jgi:hypothetical protein